MLLCLSVLSICAHAVYWKGHRLWLLSHWEPTCQPADVTLFECERVHVIRAASEHRWWQSDWGCQGGLQTFPTVSPDRKLGAAEALPCLICQQPARLMVRATLRAGRLFWFQPVWHICCLSRRVESSAWPGDDARLIRLFSFYTQSSSLQTSTVRTIWKVRGEGLMRPYNHLRIWFWSPRRFLVYGLVAAKKLLPLFWKKKDVPTELMDTLHLKRMWFIMKDKLQDYEEIWQPSVTYLNGQAEYWLQSRVGCWNVGLFWFFLFPVSLSLLLWHCHNIFWKWCLSKNIWNEIELLFLSCPISKNFLHL